MRICDDYDRLEELSEEEDDYCTDLYVEVNRKQFRAEWQQYADYNTYEDWRLDYAYQK